ncbi:MAG: YhbY family RNA-binding protein [Clostridia bacterium]|nr:YhbY family RNA-binding protein [Clostridia bacterium]
MFTTKERSKLRSLAQKIEPIGQIGKNGVTDNMLEGLSAALDKRELIKLTVLKNSDDDIIEIGNFIAEKLGAEFVCATGRKIVVYRKSDKPGVVHIKYQ